MHLLCDGPKSLQNKPSKHLLIYACAAFGQTTDYKTSYTGCKMGLDRQVAGIALQHCSLMLGIWCLQIWSTGDPSAADSIMADDVRFVDLLFEQETNGREEFKKMIGSVFKVQPSQHISCHELLMPGTLQSVHYITCPTHLEAIELD